MRDKPKQLRRKRPAWRMLAGISLAAVVAAGIYWAAREQQPHQKDSAAAAAPVTSIPASAIPPYYESEEAAKPFPAILPATYFRNPFVARAYRVAQQISGMLAQQPCYCHCDKFGHRSLLDCYASDHGAGCLICIKEVLLAEQMHQQRKSAAEIRAALERGDWRKVELQ